MSQIRDVNVCNNLIIKGSTEIQKLNNNKKVECSLNIIRFLINNYKN